MNNKSSWYKPILTWLQRVFWKNRRKDDTLQVNPLDPHTKPERVGKEDANDKDTSEEFPQ